ncbi:MAG: hypothetical protein ACREXT_19945, partial [Gammaproteobacteria bacterium]
MSAHSFRLPTDLPKNLRDSSYDGRLTHVPLQNGSELFFTRACTDAYLEGLRMIRFGALFRINAKLFGVAYGIVFHVRAGWGPPDSEAFYDWCDSVDSDTAQFARWLLDSGQYDELFAHGDALALDAFEFLPGTQIETQREALRQVTIALRGRFRRLGRAVVVVHPHHLGQPPEIK